MIVCGGIYVADYAHDPDCDLLFRALSISLTKPAFPLNFLPDQFLVKSSSFWTVLPLAPSPKTFVFNEKDANRIGMVFAYRNPKALTTEGTENTEKSKAWVK